MHFTYIYIQPFNAGRQAADAVKLDKIQLISFPIGLLLAKRPH